MFWVKNTDGKKDAVLTLTVLGFLFVMVKLLLAGSAVSFGDKKFSFGNIDAGTIAAVLTPTLGAYVSRRYTDRKFAGKEDESKNG